MKNQKGIAFLTMVILLGVIALICAGLSVVIVNDAYTVRKIKNSKQAYFLAEAGAERAIQILYDRNFDFSKIPSKKVELGDGTYSIELDTSEYATENLVLIISTGEVKDVSKTVRVLVRRREYEAFNYTVFNTGYCSYYISRFYGADIRSNDEIHIGGSPVVEGAYSYVENDIYATNGIWVDEETIVDGKQYTGGDAPQIDMPPFDASFFQHYKKLAQGSDDYYNKDHTFPSGTYTPGNGVIFVNGDVTIDGDVTINGCLVATGYISSGEGGVWYEHFTQYQVGNLPALIAQDGIHIYNTYSITINGLICSNGGVHIHGPGTNIKGSIISGAFSSIYGNTDPVGPANITYVHQNPPGLSAPAAPVEVVCWSG